MNLTPNDCVMLLTCYITGFNKPATEATQAEMYSLAILEQENLIEQKGMEWSTTAKGKCVVEYWRQTPAPVIQYIIPER